MATEDIIVRYRAETDQLSKDLNGVIQANEKLQSETDQTNKSTKQAIDSETKAAKQREQLLQKEIANLEKLRQVRSKAFDPKDIKFLNTAIADSEKKIAKLTATTTTSASKIKSTFQSAGSEISNIGKNIAAGFIAAFGVQQIIQFGRTSVDAFLEAEENANRLRFAITQVNGETEKVFDTLIRQSEELQSISIFSDDDIQRAQTALATFGLTGDQIEKLIPKILDIASANKIDLASATDTVIRAFEGQTRGLVTLGLKFDDTGSRLGNYNKLMDEAGKFTGATAEATTTLAGSLEQARNQAGELEEQIGEGLAGSFVNARLAILDFVKTALQGLGIVKQELNKQQFGQQSDTDRIIAEVEGAVEPFLKAGLSLADAQDKVIERLRDRLTTDLAKALGAKDAADQVERLRNELAALSDLQEKIARQRAQEDRILKADDLRLLKVEKLNELLKDNQAINDTIAKDNIDLINKELAVRQKAAEDGKKAVEKAAQEEVQARQKAYEQSVKDAIEFQKKIEDATTIKLQFEFQNILNTEGPTQAIAFIRKQFGDKLQAELLRLQNDINQNPLNVGLSDPEKNALALREFQKFTDELNKKFQEAGLEIEAESSDITNQVGEDFLNLPFDAALSLLLTASQKYFPKFVQESKDATDAATQDVKDYADTWIGKNEEILQSAVDIFGNLTVLFNNLSETRIQNLQRQQDAELEALDNQQKAVEDSFDKRLISEGEFRKKSDAIEAQKLATQKKLEAEANKIRRRQAQLAKAAAVFEISLQTSINVVKALGTPPVPNIVLASLAAALGAAQLAAAVSQPIPQFKKGTKGKKGSGMALVGEEGPEFTYLPNQSKVLPAKQTKTYGEALDAMYDNRFEKYVYDKFITPALVEQKRKFDSQRQESFANNIVTSMSANGLTANDLLYGLKKGTKINNVDELGQAIARYINNDRIDLRRL